MRYEPFFYDQVLDGQYGGIRGRGADLCAHRLRALLRGAQRRQLSAGIVFLDVTSAFYSVLRQLLFKLPLSEEGIAFAMQSVALPPEAFERVRARLLEQPLVERWCGDPWVNSLAGEIHQDTWFATRTLRDVACATKGTRPGDAWGDIAFNTVMIEVGREIIAETALPEVASFVPCQAAPWSEDGAEHQHQHQLTPTVFADDLAVPVIAKTPAELDAKMEAVTVTVLNAFAARGLVPNMKKGKTMAMMAYRGKGSRQAFAQRYGDEAVLPLGTNLAGAAGVACTTVYKHMGSLLDARSRLRDEILTRRAAARGAVQPLRRRFLGVQAIPLAGRRAVLQAEGISRQLYNAQTWHACTGEERALLTNSYSSLVRSLCLPSLFAKQVDGSAVLPRSVAEDMADTGVAPLQVALSCKRLLYFGRVVSFGGAELWNLICWAGFDGTEWGALLVDDLRWLGRHLGEGPAATDGADHTELVAHWGRMAHHSAPAWKAKVRRATQRAVLWEGAQAFAAMAASHIQAADPSKESAPAAAGGERWQCPDCARECLTRHALAAHRVAKHGWRTRVRYLTRDSRCQACGKDYHTRARVTNHINQYPACGEAYRQCEFIAAMTVEEEAELDAPTRSRARVARKAGVADPIHRLPPVRFHGPLLKPAVAADGVRRRCVDVAAVQSRSACGARAGAGRAQAGGTAAAAAVAAAAGAAATAACTTAAGAARTHLRRRPLRGLLVQRPQESGRPLRAALLVTGPGDGAIATDGHRLWHGRRPDGH